MTMKICYNKGNEARVVMRVSFIRWVK